MIIERHEYQTQILGWQATAQMLRAEDEATLATGEVSRPPARITNCLFGTQPRIAIEWTNTSMAERDAGWAAWHATGRVEAFFEAWAGVNEKWLTSRILNLVASSDVAGEENGVVVRWLYEPQANQTDALIALWKEWVVDPGAHTSRILQADFGIKSHVILEVEYADIVDFHTKWTAWGAQEGIEAFWGQWEQVARPGGTTELWELMP
mgnify:CR=1 FL=1